MHSDTISKKRDQRNVIKETLGDYALQKIVEFLGEENIHPGDVILLNYPFWSSTHTLDVTASSPIFSEGNFIGFTAVKIHWLDLGIEIYCHKQINSTNSAATTSLYQPLWSLKYQKLETSLQFQRNL